MGLSSDASVQHELFQPPKQGVGRLLRQNPYILGLACVRLNFLILSLSPLVS
jgi:hypothetical protein